MSYSHIPIFVRDFLSRNCKLFTGVMATLFWVKTIASSPLVNSWTDMSESKMSVLTTALVVNGLAFVLVLIFPSCVIIEGVPVSVWV